MTAAMTLAGFLSQVVGRLESAAIEYMMASVMRPGRVKSNQRARASTPWMLRALLGPSRALG